MYSYEYKNGHIEVYFNNVFLFSADSMKEAETELENYKNNEK